MDWSARAIYRQVWNLRAGTHYLLLKSYALTAGFPAYDNTADSRELKVLGVAIWRRF
jgi:hypothetical protein